MEKKRSLTHLGETKYVNDMGSNGTSPTYGTNSPVQSVETTESWGHAWPSAGVSTKDLGGNFTTMKVSFAKLEPHSVSSLRRYGYKYDGPEWAYSPYQAIKSGLAAVQPTSDANLMSLGSKAIAQCIPTNPVADAGTFIGELKEGLPKLAGKELFKSKFKDYRKYGSEFLNIEFGWKPLVSDLQKFAEAATQSDKIISQLHKDSGKNVRRRFSFPDEVTSKEQKLTAYSDVGGVSIYGGLRNGSGTLTISTETVTKTWFSGCFTYHINLGTTLPDRLNRQAAEARKLFGVELTPATVWNLAPWSWAVDWEGNIGDVLHNVSRFSQDGLVMRYGYIMQHKYVRHVYTLKGGGVWSSDPRPLEHTMVVTSESKVRRAATPFGFGFDMTALSGRQSAILGALGISRAPRKV